ncbi:MAG: ComEC family competence protein [Prevotellaceae bacterium]|jgi:competence protein ComEC|nr:ComEC family competence protein [Prevotellaceae bacterium]
MKYSISFIEYIRRLPFVRLIVPFLCGIVTEELIFKQTVNISYFLFAFLFFFVLMFFIRLGKSYKYRWLWGVLIFCNLFLLGAEIMKNRQHETTLLLDKQTFFNGIIIDKPDIDTRFTRLTLQVKAYRDSSENWIAADEKTFIYVPTDSISSALELGDVLMFKATFFANSPPKNPEEFNYAYYLARRNFFATAFVSVDDYKKIRHENLWFEKAILDIQTAMFDCFGNAGIEGDNFAVLRALIIGDKELLSDEIISSYSVAGAMHVLAVSGLHVGLVYAVLFFMLRALNERRFGKFIKAIIIFAGLWLYAALAAFSPSVCRACVMLSFVLYGDVFGKKINIYNSLAASAFFLLIINPYNIFEVGFQLSYSSVIAIVYFQPLLYKTIHIRNKILDYIFALATVSIAAQIGTSGITIFYFHTFPNYFLVTNILIIPDVTVIMFIVAAMLMLSWVPIIGVFIGKFLDICVSIANEITRNVEMLPYSLSENIYISTSQALIIIAALIFFAFYIGFKNKKNIIAIFLCFIAFCGINSFQKIEQQNQRQMIVYNTRGSSFISFVVGQNSVNIRDHESKNNNFDFNTKNNFIKLGIKNMETLLISDDFEKSGIIKSYKNNIWFNEKSIKIATENDIFQSQKPLEVDFLIVNKYLGNNAQKILDNYYPKMLIIDSSVQTWQARRWIAEAENRNINHHYVTEKGAFVLKK